MLAIVAIIIFVVWNFIIARKVGKNPWKWSVVTIFSFYVSVFCWGFIFNQFLPSLDIQFIKNIDALTYALLIGISSTAIGIIIVYFFITRHLRSFSKAVAPVPALEEERLCPHCSQSYRLIDYDLNLAHIYCSSCKKELTKPVTSLDESSATTVNEKKYPDLLLIIHDKIPTNRSGFVNSVIKSLDYSIGPATLILTQQYNNSQSLDSALPFAIASSMNHFKEYSLELDTDETIYSKFKSASSGHFIQGYSFAMFSKHNKANLKDLEEEGFWNRKDSVTSKGNNIQILPINEFHNFFLNLAKKLNTTDPDIIFSKIDAFCERCNIQYTKEALSVLNISKMFEGTQTFVMGATQEGNDLRADKCPKCGHTKMSILINN